MNEIARRATGGAGAYAAEAARLVKSKLVPEHIANDAASAEYMMNIGASLGIDPASAFQHIYVFPDGKGRLKAGLSAHLMQALAIAAGHTVAFPEVTATKVTAVLIRRTTNEDLHRFQKMREEERRLKLARLEDADRLYRMQRNQLLERIEDIRSLDSFGESPSQEEISDLRKQLAGLHGLYSFDELRQTLMATQFDLTKLVRFEVTWTMNRASTIGLTDKSTWVNYGPEMLKSRAKAGVVRDGAIDVILGVKNILGELGVELSDEDYDELSVGAPIYTPEELGADVNEDGVPVRGKIIDVTKGGSKKQDRLMEMAHAAVEKGSTPALVDWAERTAADEKLSVDNRISRIYAVQKAAQDADRGEDPVEQDGEPVPLSLHLESIIGTLKSSNN